MIGRDLDGIVTSWNTGAEWLRLNDKLATIGHLPRCTEQGTVASFLTRANFLLKFEAWQTIDCECVLIF